MPKPPASPLKPTVKKLAQRPRPAKVAAKVPPQPRQLPLPKRIWYKPWTWRPRRHLPAPPRSPLPKARHLVRASRKLLLANRKLFLGITALYGLINLILVRGLSIGGDLSSYKAQLDSVFHGAAGQIQSTVQSFVYLLSTSGGGSTSLSSSSQILLLIIVSLAFIWALRQTTAKHKPRVRDSFYQGMYPLVPFIVVLVVLSIQLIPIVVGANIFSLVISNGIATDIGEKLLVFIPFALLALWSLRMITASLFALYIVSLPDMTPLKALRSARDLVYKRRLLIWRKLILLPFVLLLFAAIVEIPLVLFWTSAAEQFFFLYGMVALAFIHGYLYSLYRELL